MRALCIGLFTSMLVACGPGGRGELPDGPGGPGDPDAPPAECIPTAETCSDLVDNDCDLRVDCGDPDCSGVGDCPVCGTVENPESEPLALPDGIGQSTVCSTDAQCTTAELPFCVFKECHASYSSKLNFIGFPMGATLDDPTKLLSVCTTMEHSWLRDLQMDLVTPDGRIITLHKFVGRTPVQETFLGSPNDLDDAEDPVPGTGAKYCWTPGAAKTMLETAPPSGHFNLPAGDYKSVSPWAALQGSPLNGEWEMRVTDLWPIDNGFLFDWSISFDPSLVQDCSGPIIQ